MGKRKSKAGRPRSAAARTKSGRLSRAGKIKNVAPNKRVVETREAFKTFKGGLSAESYDPIGRAWLVGLLDGHGIPPDCLRDAGRTYADSFWGYYGKTGLAMADLEPEARGSGARKALDSDIIPDDPQGEWLENIDKVLCRAGRPVRTALHNVVIDQFFLPNGDPVWLGRLITGRRIAARHRLATEGKLPADIPPILGALPSALDEAKLANLITALRILVTGRITVPAAPVQAEAAPKAPPPPLPPIDPAFLTEAGRMRESSEIAGIIRERHITGQQQGESR